MKNNMATRLEPKAWSIWHRLLLLVWICCGLSFLLKAEGTDQRVELSEDERHYLRSLGKVSMCVDPEWMPYELVTDQGEFIGIAADLISIIARRAGLDLELIITTNWEESLVYSQQGQCLILAFLNQTPEREEWLVFTEPYFTDYNVFITREEHDYIADPAQLVDKTIVLPRGTSVEERIRNDYPNLQVLIVETEAEAIAMVDRREADMTMRSLTMAAYTIKREGLFNLKIAGQLPDYVNLFRIGVAKEEPLLRDILNKSIATLTTQEVQQAINNHVSIEVYTGVDYGLIIRIIVLFSIVLLAGLLWTYQLRKLNARLARQQLELSRLSEEQKKEIRARQQVEAELRESENNLSSLISNLPGMVYHCANDRHWTMEYVSDGCVALTGYTPDELINNKAIAFGDLIHEQDRANNWDQWQQSLAAGNHFEGEYRIITKNNEIRWVWERGHANYNSNAEIIRLEGFITDVTEKKRSEKMIQAAREQAEAANKAKSQFLANMSHEIRTPLNGVIGFTELLKNSPIEETSRSYANNAYLSAHSLMKIINDILDFSKVEAGKIELDPMMTDLPELIRQLGEAFRIEADKKRIRLVTHVDPHLPRYVFVDPLRLRQILSNLLGNAIKFTGTGQVELHLGFTPIDEERGAFTFSVKDTGIGIDEEQARKLFQAFMQADASTTRKYGGTGLGLAIANHLASLMGSTIHLDSIPGKGSRFSFEITTTFRQQTDKELAATEEADRQTSYLVEGSPVIIVAEDVPMNMELTLSMLKKIAPDAEVVEATDGKQVLEITNKIRADLILMDIQMPNMDGIKATRLFRQMEAGIKAKKATPVIALTAGSMPEQRQKCLAAGMNDFLAKPIEEASLGKMLSLYLHTKKQSAQQTGTVVTEHPSANTHFDLTALRERTGVEESVLLVLAKNAANSLSNHLDTLSAALSSQNLEQVKRAAHTIKGVSLNMSFVQLAQMARQMELQSAEAAPERLHSLFNEMKQEVASIQATFQ